MIKVVLLSISILLSLSGFAQDPDKSTYFLIRHAEKDRSDAENKDPVLTEKGQQRALKWSELFVHYGIDAVYSTDYNRTLLTAKPTASALTLKITTYHPFKLDFENFLKETKGKNVLVVGHSNTIPFFVNKLIGQDNFYQQMEDNDNASLYIVTKQGTTSDHVLIKTKD
ncbi:MAG: phosphoglycerate mutase family protein [Flavobacteriaceae bacterium]|nr:phosphoglycerate mutase family protein [Flavobacteriaceae bacterium]